MKFVKVTSLYSHEIKAPEDVFPKSSSLKAPTDVRIWCPLPIYNWRHGNLAKLHAHAIMMSPASECICLMGSSPRAGCTYYLNFNNYSWR